MLAAAEAKKAPAPAAPTPAAAPAAPAAAAPTPAPALAHLRGTTQKASRIRQLATNRRISQVPTSELSRVVSNYRLADDPDPSVTACWANFALIEDRASRLRTWAGKSLYRLRDLEGQLQMIEKRVVLVDRSAALDTFTFIL